MSALFEELDYRETPIGALTCAAGASCGSASTCSRSSSARTS